VDTHFYQGSLTQFIVNHNLFQKLEMGPDLTQAYFWPAVNKRPTRLWPGYFLTFFPNPNQRWLTWPNPTRATKNWPNPGQNFDPKPITKKNPWAILESEGKWTTGVDVSRGRMNPLQKSWDGLGIPNFSIFLPLGQKKSDQLHNFHFFQLI